MGAGLDPLFFLRSAVLGDFRGKDAVVRGGVRMTRVQEALAVRRRH